jgi:hypothetical protein
MGDCPLSDVGKSMWGCPDKLDHQRATLSDLHQRATLSDLERKLAELKLKIEQKKLELKE